jgi:hypothetical protein
MTTSNAKSRPANALEAWRLIGKLGLRLASLPHGSSVEAAGYLRPTSREVHDGITATFLDF